MAGLLDFMNTPAGIGLLSAVAGGAATARRGTPINNLGRGLASGLSGYQTAQGQIAQDEENALARQFRQMQMEQIQNTLAQNKAQRAWREGLPGAMEAAKTKQMPFEADNPFGENLGQLSTVQQGDPQALQRYLMQPDSPYAERMVEKQLFPTQQDLMKVSAGETLIDPITRQPVYTAPAKQQDTFSQDMRDYLGAYGIDPASASREQLSSAYQAVQGAKDRRASMSANTVTYGTPIQYNTPAGPVLVQPGNRPGAAPMITKLPEGVTPQTKQAPMSAQLQKELIESDDIGLASDNVVKTIDTALALNDKAYSGYGAKERALIRSNMPGEDPAANATIDLDNLMTGQALESLKLIFGGTPTEGERQILLDIQASADKTPAQRATIMKRAREAAVRRKQYASSKAKAIREGTYLTEGIKVPEQPTQPVAGGVKFLGFE